MGILKSMAWRDHGEEGLLVTPPIHHCRDLQRGVFACDVVWARSSVYEVLQESNVEYISRFDIIVHLQKGYVGRYLLPAVSAEFCQFVPSCY